MTWMNEAGWDRALRVALGVALAVVGWGALEGTAGVVVGVLALVPLVTGLVGWCPLYALLGVRTARAAEHPPAGLAG